MMNLIYNQNREIFGGFMKKILPIVAIMILSLSFFACDLGDAITGPRDTWCERTITVKDVDFTCYLLYSEQGYSHSDLNSSKFENQKISKGLTVVLAPVSSGVTWFTNPYVVKTFGLGENSVEAKEDIDSSKNPKTFTVGNSLWNAIWMCNMTTFNQNGPRTSPPTILRTDVVFNPFADIAELSWKEVVIAILEGI